MISSDIVIRLLAESDLERVSFIHLKAFTDRALARMGKQAVYRYYKWLLLGPHDVYALGAYKENQLIGFCFGGVFRGALSGFLSKNRNFLISQILIRPWLVFNPLLRDRIGVALRSLRSRSVPPKPSTSRADESPKVEREPKSFGIVAIAVHPDYWGSSAAKQMMLNAEAYAKQAGFAWMKLSVDSENARAIRFYEKLGWEKVIVDGKWDERMSKGLSTD